MSLTSADIEKFVEVLKQSGLLNESAINERYQEFTTAIEESADQNAAGSTADLSEEFTPEAFASYLVDQGCITSWHASKLLKGKHKGFFLGKYKLLRLLGKGGMSSVYLAEHVNMKRQCAVKVLPYKLVSDSSYLARFYREAQAVAALDDPNIVRAYDVDHQTDGDMEIHFLVMEYVAGMNFYELVKTQGPLTPALAAEYIRQGALGLEHAHQAGMVHRDIKPGNFLIDKNGTVKLMDLGLAMVLSENKDFSVTLENEEKVLGTADYLAPEQAVDSHLVDHRADIYALGCTFFFLLTGRPPFDEGTLAQRLLAHQNKQPPDLNQLRPGIPQELVHLTSQMMAKAPEERIQTAGEIANRLQSWLAREKQPDGGIVTPTIHIETDAPGSDPKSSRPQDGAISEFLSHLEDRSSKADIPTRSGYDSGTKKSQQTNPPRDSNPQLVSNSEITIFNSGKSSIISSVERESQASRKRKKRLGFQPLYVAIVSLSILAAIVVLFLLNRDPEKGNKPQQAELTSQPREENDQSEQTTLKSVSTIAVGPEGDFEQLGSAIDFLMDPANADAARQVQEIRVAAGLTIEESITLAPSGLSTLPKPFRITGEGPELPVWKGTADSLLKIDSVEQLTVENFRIDCTDLSHAITLTGYLSDTRLRNLKFENLANIAIFAKGAAGLVGHPVTIEQCQVIANSDSAVGIRFEGSETSNTRLINLFDCQFIGPMSRGIVFSGPQGSTWDLELIGNLFHKTGTGIAFVGQEHDVSQVLIGNNTFHQFNRGIQFEAGPVPASSGITFVQNIFADGTGHEVSTDRENVDPRELSANAPPHQHNWTTGSGPGSAHWLNIFESHGKLSAQIEFASTDPESNDFLKPTGELGSQRVTGSNTGRSYIGSVQP